MLVLFGLGGSKTRKIRRNPRDSSLCFVWSHRENFLQKYSLTSFGHPEDVKLKVEKKKTEKLRKKKSFSREKGEPKTRPSLPISFLFQSHIPPWTK